MTGVIMDRRQKKTRKAIFIAFNELLSNKAYDKITVQEIISAADIGRTTFYAHFDTKEALLEALCEDLFLHIKDSINHLPHAHGLYQQSIYPVSVFGHLLQHLQQNENKILELLASDNNEIFLRYFRDHLNELVQGYFINQDRKANTNLPDDFIINHTSPKGKQVVVEKSEQGKWKWKQVGKGQFIVNGNVLEMAIPKSVLGLSSSVNLEFKWSDNMQDEGNIMDFYVNGDVAPGGRFNFVYCSVGD